MKLPCNHHFDDGTNTSFIFITDLHRQILVNSITAKVVFLTETKKTRYRLHEPVTILPTCKNMLP